MFTGLMIDTLYEPDLAFGFIWTVAVTIFLFFRAIDRERTDSKKRFIIGFILFGWLFLQWLLSINTFYLDFSGVPPRMAFAVLPPVIFIICIFFFKREWLYFFSLKKLTLVHIVRVLVEIILLGLFLDRQIPRDMTFEGVNFDILSGLTTPVILWLCFRKGKINKKLLLGWNIICLLLLFTIVGVAFFSAPTVFQKLNFSQPNVAIGYFPFIWLPSFVVPVVLFSHLAVIKRLTMEIRGN